MDLEEFKRVEGIFDLAAELPRSERDAYLDQACAGDEALRQRVLRMLEHATRDFVCEELEELHDRPVDTDGLDDLSGTTIGSYEVKEQIGEGGFGDVYLAQQNQPVRRRVALKIIKLGMDTKQVIARFEAERQALAMMSHPHVAQVYDAGVTDTGRPYFVMEYVPGVPITQYCDDQCLSLPQRLHLFIQVCLAVQHAHQKGIIHRDIKPSNVMVTTGDATGKPAPKVIDFGIAKATHGRLTDKTLHTEFRQFIGTPEYMSPEQAALSGADIDTRSDIYSLGVLLYELLAGVSPFGLSEMRKAGRDDILRIIREQEPKKPSTHLSTLGQRLDEVARQRGTEPRLLRRTLRGDLDWIILKAMEKDPARRYESVAELAHEIERYLGNRPIKARPPGPVYLARKFIHRHRLAVGAVAVVILALNIGLVAALVGLREAKIANDVKQMALDVAEQHLWESLLAQARAARTSDQIGRRYLALDAIARAAEIRPAGSLRDEAIACMALPDFEFIRSVPTSSDPSVASLRVIDRLAYSTGVGEISVISLEDRRELAHLVGPELTCWIRTFTPDGRYLGAKFHEVNSDVHFVVWDLETQEVVLHVTRPLNISNHFSFCSWEGRTAFAVGGGDRRIEVYAVPEGQLVQTLQLEHVSANFIADPEGRRLSVAHYDESLVTIWDVERGEIVRTIEGAEKIRATGWSADGARLAGCGGGYSIFIWNAATGEQEAQFTGHQGMPVGVFFSPDGRYLASHAWDNTTRIWDLAKGDAMLRPLGNTSVVGIGDLLVTSDGPRAVLRRFEPAPEFRRTIDRNPRNPRNDRHQVTIDEHGDWLATSGPDGARLWDANTGEAIAPLSDTEVLGAAFDRDSETVIYAQQDAVFHRSLTRVDDRVQVGSAMRLIGRSGIRGMSVDVKHRRLGLSLEDGTELYDLDRGTLLVALPHYRGQDQTVSIDPNGRWIMTGCWRGEGARVWDLESRTMIREFPGASVRGAFSPDGHWLIVTTGAANDIYRTESWELAVSRPRDNNDDLAGVVAFSADSRLAAITHSRFEIHLIDVEANRILARLSAPDPEVVSSLFISADGSLLATANAVDEVKIWDLARIREGLRRFVLDWDQID